MSSLETWDLEGSDFALVAEDGETTLRCHKDRLAESSGYFKAMLSHDCWETSNNQMDVPQFGGVTVASCLEWIYAPKNEASSAEGEFSPEKQFDVQKFSPGIFMAHLYPAAKS